VRKYFSLQSDCKNCPIRKSCISDKAKTKKIQHSIYKPELERAKARQQSTKGKVMKRKRSSTVEPVWGTLINFMGMKRMNARGLAAANKMLLLATACYNLKKWLKLTAPKTNIKTMAIAKTKARQAFAFIKMVLIRLIAELNAASSFLHIRHCWRKKKKNKTRYWLYNLLQATVFELFFEMTVVQQ